MFNHVTKKMARPALPLHECLAKTYQTINGEKRAGRLILPHCLIVAEVTREIRSRMPQWLADLFFPEGCILLNGEHDIGKVCPTSQKKYRLNTDSDQHKPCPELDGINPDIDENKEWGGHATVSKLTAKALNLGKFIPDILGIHHGNLYDGTMDENHESFGGPAWQSRRKELVERLKFELKVDHPVIKDDVQSKLLAGFLNVSDWTGSGAIFDDPAIDWKPLIKQSVDEAGFIRPTLKYDLSFTAIFGFKINDIQQRFFDQINGPGVYILEAPMGLGKTEAALYVAYKMLCSEKSTGIYFALPTQLTSDQIHQRLENFLKHILEDDSAHRRPLLLHGNAEFGEEGRPGGSWFNNSKKGILAPFAAGTLDQALMAVMNVRHSGVRAFGLAGKVVILDEVHSYDAYTGTLLIELVGFLRQLHCTVIILSATLTRKNRALLLGRDPSKSNYPLISSAPLEGAFVEQPVNPMDDHRVKIKCSSDETAAINEALTRATQGQQVLWIENTVGDAQRIFELILSSADPSKIACGLVHSRFLIIDREENERHWTTAYGKEGFKLRGVQGRILVGTQVLEQSLDIDADFLISRFAPSDLILQRLGRLWRHYQLFLRAAGSKREAWLLAPSLDHAIRDPKEAFGKTANVYSPYVLCRSLELWQNLKSIDVPSQIREVIERTYVEREEIGDMLNHYNVLKKGIEKMKGLALLGLSGGLQPLSDHSVKTRYSEQESVEILLIKQIDKDSLGVTLTLLDNTEIVLPTNGVGLMAKQKSELAKLLLKNTVKVAHYLAPEPVSKKELDWLNGYMYLGKPHDENSLIRGLRVARVLPNNAVVGLNGGKASCRYSIQYDKLLGYQAKALK